MINYRDLNIPVSEELPYKYNKEAVEKIGEIFPQIKDEIVLVDKEYRNAGGKSYRLHGEYHYANSDGNGVRVIWQKGVLKMYYLQKTWKLGLSNISVMNKQVNFKSIKKEVKNGM